MQEKSFIKQKILQFIDYKGISKYRFYQETGITRGVLDQNNGMSEENTVKFLAQYPEINAEWLLTGRGNMLKDDHENQSPNITLHHGNRKTRDKIIESQEIPLYELEATAGLVELFRGGQTARVLETIKIPNLPPCDGALSVTGDSMYPLLKSGDIVLYKQIPVSTEAIFFGEMYLLGISIDEYEEMITVKYVQKSDKGDNYIKLVSLNQHHQSKDVLLNRVTAMAIIKASIRFNTMF